MAFISPKSDVPAPKSLGVAGWTCRMLTAS